ncbi:MAG TPA: PAS domain S-box protein [Pyrinomonadaceae bacterium]|nr:PAS domain S-box protein [Pyrinomonadaceae bacterium]
MSAPVSVQDFTKQKQDHDPLFETRAYLQAIFLNSLDAILVTNDQGHFIDANPAACALLGYTHPELMQLSVIDLATAEFREGGWARWQSFLAYGRGSGELSARHSDSSVLNLKFRSVANIVPGVHVSFIHDVTDRKRAELAQRAAEEKYESIFENALEGIFQTSREGQFVVANPALARMFGFDSPEELIRERADLSGQHYVNPRRREEFKRLMDAADVIHEFEYEAYRKDGSTIWVSDNVRAVRDESGNLVCYEGIAKDITERKRAETALRESEERYRDLFENAKDAYYIHDVQGRYTSVNRAAEKLAGYSRADIIGRSFADFLPPEQLDAVAEHLCKKLVEKGETTYETEMITRDGRRVPIEVSSHLIYDDITGVSVRGTVRDITERRWSEERLREYEKVVEGIEEMITVVDRDYRYVLVNRAFLKYRRMNREELMGKYVPDVLGKEVFERLVKARLEEALEGHVVTFEIKITYPHLGERDLHISYFPIEGPSGIEGAACVIQDITERRHSEEALRQSEERFSKAFHSSPAALSITQLEDGELMEVNESFLRMTGFTREELIGKTALELGLWRDPAKWAKMMAFLLQNSEATDIEINFWRKSGEKRSGLLSVDLIELSGRKCVLGSCQDITERKEAEATLRNYSRMLVEAQETERKHIARELHDQIGQMLTAIKFTLQTLGSSNQIGSTTTVIDQGVGLIDTALDQVRNLSFELRPSLLDNLGLVAALRWYSDQFALRTGIVTTCQSNLPEGKMRFRQELETACFRIVQEALTNVVRHAEARNVVIELDTADQQTILSIKDDGVGFSKQAPQENNPANVHLGLIGMRERALALGGTLEISSAPGKGTEIRVFIPTEATPD